MAKKAKAVKKPKTAKKVLAKKMAKKPAKKTPPKAAAKKAAAKKAPVKKSLALSPLLTPLDDRLVVQVEESEKMTSGGLYIPDTASGSGNFKGTVLAVGRGHKNKKGKIRPMDVKPGDQVLFDQYAGSKMTLANAEVLILRESEILGIVESK